MTHSLVLLEGDEVYSFGFCNRAQLGHGDQEKQWLPELIAALQGKRVVHVSAGVYHSLALVDGGEVYSFGKGKEGQLGHGDQNQQWLPKLIAALQDKRAVQVSDGSRHSLVLLEDGKVHSFGLGANGQLGHGDQENQLVPKLVAVTSTQQGYVCVGGRGEFALEPAADRERRGGYTRWQAHA